MRAPITKKAPVLGAILRTFVFRIRQNEPRNLYQLYQLPGKKIKAIAPRFYLITFAFLTRASYHKVSQQTCI